MSDATATLDPAQHLLQLSTGYVVSTALQIATDLGVADRLSGGPLTVRELAAATATNEDALYCVLRLLKYPRMRGILMDLDHVIPGARARFEAKDWRIAARPWPETSSKRCRRPATRI